MIETSKKQKAVTISQNRESPTKTKRRISYLTEKKRKEKAMKEKVLIEMGLSPPRRKRGDGDRIGLLDFDEPAPKKKKKKFNLDDFEVKSSLARGAFGFVYLVEHKPTS